jgi:hypothetical protein
VRSSVGFGGLVRAERETVPDGSSRTGTARVEAQSGWPPLGRAPARGGRVTQSLSHTNRCPCCLYPARLEPSSAAALRDPCGPHLPLNRGAAARESPSGHPAQPGGSASSTASRACPSRRATSTGGPIGLAVVVAASFWCAPARSGRYGGSAPGRQHRLPWLTPGQRDRGGRRDSDPATASNVTSRAASHWAGDEGRLE